MTTKNANTQKAKSAPKTASKQASSKDPATADTKVAAKPDTNSVMVFARERNQAEAVCEKAGLDPDIVELVIDSEEETSTWRKVSEFPGKVFSTEMIGARIGAPQFRLPMFPRIRRPKRMNAFQKRAFEKAKAKAWEELRDPETPTEILLAAMDEPVQLLSCEVGEYEGEMLEGFSELVDEIGNEELTQGWASIRQIIGLDPMVDDDDDDSSESTV